MIRNKIILLVVVVFINTTAISQIPETGNLIEFEKNVSKHKMQFQTPIEFHETNIFSTEQIPINYAIHHNKEKLEIRYYIHSIKDKLEYNKSNPPDEIEYDPDEFYKGDADFFFQNLEKSKSEVVAFDKSVTNKFGADYAAFISSQPKPKFDAKYKYIVVVFLYKKSIASSYSIYLFDDFTVYKKYSKDAFFALKYKRD
jgi:hypothetical protein